MLTFDLNIGQNAWLEWLVASKEQLLLLSLFPSVRAGGVQSA